MGTCLPEVQLYHWGKFHFLEFNATPFPLCQTLITDKAPFDTLWSTAIHFFEQQDKWLNGPFSDLDAQTIQNELDDKTKVI